MDFENLQLEEALTSEELLIYSRNLAIPRGYLHNVLFPPKETMELTVDVIREQSNLPVMAQIAELGTEVEYGSREGMTGDRISIPKIQRGRFMDEKLVRILLQGNLRRDEFAQIRNEQLDDAQYAVDAIRARREWIPMQLISTGKVVYQEGGVQFTVDYGYRPDQTPVLTGTDKWSDTVNSNPLQDIQEWVESAYDKGFILTRALTSRKIVGLLLQNLNIRKAYFGDPSGSANPPQLNRAQLNTLFDSLGLPTIVEYDTQARTEDRALTAGKLSFTNVRMMPQNRFVLLPEGPLGDYLWARTTEEMISDIEVEQSGDMGIYVFRTWNQHPIRLHTIGVSLCFPTFPTADQVISAQVID